MPASYCLSHLLLLEFDPPQIARRGFLGGVAVAQNTPRLFAYAVVVGLSFGFVFGTLQCLPARLFGRRDLPKLQSILYGAILLSTASFNPFVGWLRDYFDGYVAPLLLTFCASFLLVGLMLFLAKEDAEATRGSSRAYAVM